MASVGRTGATMLIFSSSFLECRSQVLRSPCPESRVGDKVVVHRRLAVVAEVQHTGLLVQKPTRVLKQSVEREKPRPVGRQVDLRMQRVALVIFERHV